MAAESPVCPSCADPGVLMKASHPAAAVAPAGARYCFGCDKTFGWNAPVVTAEQALDAFRARVAGADLDAIEEAMLERLALRGLGEGWSVHRGPRAVRVFCRPRPGAKSVSRYVWSPSEADLVLGYVAARCREARPPAEQGAA